MKNVFFIQSIILMQKKDSNYHISLSSSKLKAFHITNNRFYYKLLNTEKKLTVNAIMACAIRASTAPSNAN